METLLRRYVDYFAHVQFSPVHERGQPDVGEIIYRYVPGVLENAGDKGYIGAEYKPREQDEESGLSWLKHFHTF